MDDRNSTSHELTTGLDLGDRISHLATLDASGVMVERGRVPSTPTGLCRRFGEIEPRRIVLETGTHSPWISRLLTEQGHEVIVADARRLPLISRNDRKTDRTDAELLARLGRLDPDLLRPIRHRSARAQADLALLRSRDALVAARTALINHVRGSTKAFGGRLLKCSTRCFATKAAPAIPTPLAVALGPVLAHIEELSRSIRQMEAQVKELSAESYPETALLRQVAGIGPLTALSYVLIIEDPSRFQISRLVGSYLGLAPRSKDSGDHRPQCRIAKTGNAQLRKLLVTAAHYVLGPHGPDTDLRRWGLALAERGGKAAKKRAVVAVARRLAVLLHRLWITGEAYEPLRLAQATPIAA